MPGVNIELHVNGTIEKLKEGTFDPDPGYTQSAGEFVQQFKNIEESRVSGKTLNRDSRISPLEAMNAVIDNQQIIAGLSEEQRAANLQYHFDNSTKPLVKKKRRRGKRGGKNTHRPDNILQAMDRNDPIW